MQHPPKVTTSPGSAPTPLPPPTSFTQIHTAPSSHLAARDASLTPPQEGSFLQESSSGPDMAQGLTQDGEGKEKEMFQLGSHNKCGCRQEAREDRPRNTGPRAHRAGRTCPAPGVYTGSSECRQTGGMGPQQQWPRSITFAPRSPPGNVPSTSGHVSMRGEKGHNAHKSQGLAAVRGCISYSGPPGRQVGTSQFPRKMRARF